jgi:hypothetical protein|tara:strand:- start:326 stop:553 length:228 start_codon:yes stop_codon:yes gene_type:complete
MSTTKIADKFIMWRIHGMQMAEKRLLMMLNADVKEGASDQELDALLEMISKGLRDISHMQNEIITLQTLLDDVKK